MNFKIILSLTLLVTSLNICHSQEVTLFGTQVYEDDSKISRAQIASLMTKDPVTDHLWKKSKRHNTIGYLAFAAQLGCTYWLLNTMDRQGVKIAPTVGFIATTATSFAFGFSSANLQKKAILTYNKNLDFSQIYFGPTYNGLGMVVSF